MRTQRRRDESGSALVLVLAVLVGVATIAATALAFANTSISSSKEVYRPHRAMVYDADGAIQTAIQYVKQNQQSGGSLGKDTGRPCPPSPGADPDATFQYQGSSAGTSYKVLICPQLDSFNLDGNSRAVLLTLAGPTSDEGIDFAKNTDNQINGDAWSNSYLKLQSSASMDVNGGRLWVWDDDGDIDNDNNGTCAAVNALLLQDCNANDTFAFTTLAALANNSQTTITVAANSKFPQLPSEQFVVFVGAEQMRVTAGQGTNSWTVTRGYGGTTPAGHGNGTPVNFLPKTGMDPADPLLGHEADWQPDGTPPLAVTTPSGCALSPGRYISGSALSNACAGAMTLSPGMYYLDFPASDDTWTINSNVTVTGACVAGQGVQLVFANNAKMYMDKDSLVNLCGRRKGGSASAPQIAMTYQKTSAASGPSTNAVLRPTAAPTQGGHNLFDPLTLVNVVPTVAPGYPQDATYATATVAQNNRVALLNIGNMSPVSGGPIPSNAVITSAVVKVGHDETTGWGFPGSGPNQPQLSWGGCTVPLAPAPTILPPGTPPPYTSNNLSAALSACPTFDRSQPATVIWGVQSSNGSSQTTRVDGAQVEVTWNTPGVAGQTGCVTQLLNAGGCYLWSGPTNGNGINLDITGVVYLPKNALSGTFKNGGQLKISQALIVRSFNFETNPAAIGNATIGGGPGEFTAGKVLFRAFVGPDEWADAYATFDANSSPTLFKPTINSWVNKH